jgi:hypothetical protein
MHATNAGEKRKALQKAAKSLPKAREKPRELQGEADTARAEALALKTLARLEDLHIWVLEKVKTTKKGSKKYTYWMATWREGGKTRNVHLGSCAKMEEETALQKARAMKAEALAIKL